MIYLSSDKEIKFVKNKQEKHFRENGNAFCFSVEATIAREPRGRLQINALRCMQKNIYKN